MALRASPTFWPAVGMGKGSGVKTDTSADLPRLLRKSWIRKAAS